MNQKIYKAALIGCGKMGSSRFDHLKDIFPKGWLPLSHAAAMQSHLRIDLVALCDTDAEKLKAAADDYNVLKTFQDLDQMLEQKNPDLISIATRTPPRTNIIETCINSGVKAMHIEKPLCQSLHETKHILQQLADNKVKFTYGTLRRFMAAYRNAKAMIDAGEIGAVKHVVVENDVTTLMWNHPHAADMLVYFSGSSNPVTVQAHCSGKDKIPAVESHVIEEDLTLHQASVTFDNGVSGHILSAPGMNTRIYGEKGIITIGADGGFITRQKMRNDFYMAAPDIISFDVPTSAMEYVYHNLVEQIEGTAKPVITADEILASQTILFGCGFSTQRQGQVIDLSDLPDDYRLIGKSGEFYA